LLKNCFLWILHPFEYAFGLVKRKKNILFVTSNKVMFDQVSFICDELKKDPRLSLWFCFSSPCRFDKKTLSELKKERKNTPFSIAKFIKWDLIIFPDHDYGFRRDVKKIFIGHGPPMSKRVNGEYYMFGDDAVYKGGEYKYDRTFVYSEKQKREATKLYPQFYGKVDIVPSMRMWDISKKQQEKEELFREWNLDPAKKTIIFTSTWDRSLVCSHGKALLSLLPALLREYNVVVSLHPKTIISSDSGFDSFARKIFEFKARDFVCFSGSSWAPFVSTCDLLITDHTSMACYFLPYIRRVIFVDIPDVEAGDMMRRIASKCHRIKDLTVLEGDIKEAFLIDRKQDYENLASDYLGDYKNSMNIFKKEVCGFLGVTRAGSAYAKDNERGEL